MTFNSLPSVARDPAPSALTEEVSALFEQFRSPLYRYLLSFGLSTADCEEIAQETFLALFRHLKNNGGRQHLRGWIFRVGHNLALKARQRPAYRNLPLDDNLREFHPHPDPDPEAQAAAAQWRAQMAAIFRALPETDRACLSLRAEGLRYREISHILGMSLGGVAQSLARSLAKFARVTALHETGSGISRR